ncbi:IS3 family transposase [Piscirickettsia salmonis]|uniref:IS3 family transposase n=1 Tax=Piscirickettsia salmonis TaxID=1238 RepID=UPI0037504C61
MSRQQYSSSKKFQIALEAIKGKETIAALSTKHGIAPTLISKWKKDLLERGCELFEKGYKTSLKGENHKTYDYLLDGLHIARPNHAWQVDITYIRTRKGFAYLTALIDVYSRYIVGWALSNTMEVSFCLEALNQALEQGQPEIINSDQGRQFTGNGWISALKNRKIKVSMTGKGRCIDNVYIERFWRSIKHEKIKLCEFDDIHELEDLISEYIHHSLRAMEC